MIVQRFAANLAAVLFVLVNYRRTNLPFFEFQLNLNASYPVQTCVRILYNAFMPLGS